MLAAFVLRCVTCAVIMSDIMDAALHYAGEHSRQPDEMSDITVRADGPALIPVPGGPAMVRRRRQSPRIGARMPW
jgi:hypothetical protein